MCPMSFLEFNINNRKIPLICLILEKKNRKTHAHKDKGHKNM